MLKIFKKNETAGIAKERLQAVLVTDRLHCSNAQMKEMEIDMFRSINKYFAVTPSKIKTRILQKDGTEDEYTLIFEATIKR